MMRILCFIDILGSGGAQRQLVNLAVELKKRGYDVSFLVYHAADFYLPILQEFGINVELIEQDSYIKRLFLCRRFIRRGRFDVVISFLEAPSFISEVAGIPFHKWKIIVGERSANPNILRTFKGYFYRWCHVFADVVVSNSECNRLLIQKVMPLLSKKKNITIYNLYDLEKLNSLNFERRAKRDEKFHLLVAASHQRIKNLKNLAIAISLLPKEKKERLVVEWYGRQMKECFEESLLLIHELGIENSFLFYPPTLEIYSKMANADAIGSFSIYEGLSNTICEAMCLGKVVIATDVSDNRSLLQNDRLIADAQSPKSIVKSLSYLLDLSQTELDSIGRKNRAHAEALFDRETILNQYSNLF